MRKLPPAVDRRYRNNLQNETTFKSRIHIGQIISVDNANGQVLVRDATSNEEWKLQIPLGGFSMRGLSSSWIRYMPQRQDYVKIGFGPDNSPELLGYAAFGEEFAPDGTRQSSIAVPRQGLYATIERLKNSGRDGFNVIFRTLDEGEWDMRSAGGAEIYGTRAGTLNLAGGGGATIRLSKARQEENHQAQLTTFDDTGVEVRFGQVKRKLLPTDAEESTPIIPNPGAFLGGTSGISSTLREHKVVVGVPMPPLGTPVLSYWSEESGTVTDSRGTPALARPSALPGITQLVPFPPNPLRHRTQAYALDGLLPSLRVEIDFLGNVQIEQLPTAPIGVSLTAARLFLHANTTTATLASNLPVAGVFLGSEGALLSASGVPGSLGIPQAYVLGTAWTIARIAYHAAMTALHGTAAGGLTTAGAGLTGAMNAAFIALTAALTGPPPASSVGQVVAALLAFAGAGAAASTVTGAGLTVAAGAETGMAAAVTGFEAAGLPTGFLSVKVFGE